MLLSIEFLNLVNIKINNYCSHRLLCTKSHICLKGSKYYYKNYSCANCSKCNLNCKDFSKEVCPQITSAPYVCNSCTKKNNCHLDKYFYFATTAQNEYKSKLIESREGINIDENKLKILDATISPLIKNVNLLIKYLLLIVKLILHLKLFIIILI